MLSEAKHLYTNVSFLKTAYDPQVLLRLHHDQQVTHPVHGCDEWKKKIVLIDSLNPEWKDLSEE